MMEKKYYSSNTNVDSRKPNQVIQTFSMQKQATILQVFYFFFSESERQ